MDEEEEYSRSETAVNLNPDYQRVVEDEENFVL